MAAAIVSHWNGDYLYESENRSKRQLHIAEKSNLTSRPDDGAVIHAITTFGEVATKVLKLI